MTYVVAIFSSALFLFIVVGLLELWLLNNKRSGILTEGLSGMAKVFRDLVWKWITQKKRRDNNSDDVLVDHLSRSSNLESNTSAVTSSSSLCDSEDCIRCSKNLNILSTALTKLSYYLPNSKSKGKNNYSDQDMYLSLINDVKNSLEIVKKDKNNFEDLLSFDEESLLKPSTSQISKIGIQNPVVFHMSSLRKQEFWPVCEFSDLSILSENWRKIALECLHLYQSPLPETKSLWKVNTTSSGKWEIAQLVDQGWITKAGEYCPLTKDIIKKISPFISGCYFGDASFSIVHPGTNIPTHCGSTNCRIRCHLGLKVPQGKCTLTVSNQQQKWVEGDILCFDDSFPHSVQHSGGDSSGYRAVFMIDLWHPDLSQSQRDIIAYAFSP